MSPAWFIVESRADDDVQAAYQWHEAQRGGLGECFSAERSAYFVIEDDIVIVFDELHERRDPALWRHRRRWPYQARDRSRAAGPAHGAY